MMGIVTLLAGLFALATADIGMNCSGTLLAQLAIPNAHPLINATEFRSIRRDAEQMCRSLTACEAFEINAVEGKVRLSDAFFMMVIALILFWNWRR
jgi:hypothetical protein